MPASIKDLEDALVNADAAGDEDAARGLAAEIQRMQAAPPAEQGIDRKLYDALPEGVKGAVDTLAQFSSGGIEGIIRTLDALETMSPAGAIRQLAEKAGVPTENIPGRVAPLVRQGAEAIGAIVPPDESGAGRIVRRAGEEVGAAMIPAAGISTLARSAAQGGALVKPALEAFRAAPGKFLATETAAAAGAGVGAGVAQEIAPESKGAEVVGLLVGALAPSAIPGSVRALVRGGDGTRRTMERSIKEFAEAGVTPTVGMASRRRFNEAVEAGLAILPGSSGRMAIYAESTARKLHNRVDDITAGLSPLRSTDTAGTAIQSGVKGFVSRFKDKWRTLDSQVARFVKPDDAVGMRNTRGALAELAADPIKLAEYPQLGKVVQTLDDLSASGAMRYQDLRTYRTSVGSMLAEKLTVNVPQGALKNLYKAMTADLRGRLDTRTAAQIAANAPKPPGLRAFDRANKYYESAMRRLDERLAPLTSSDIPERVFLALERSGHAGRTVVNAAKRSIGKENWDVVAATVFQRMGTATPGQQSMAGDIFSVQTFLTNWNKYAQNRGALEALLSGTSGGSKFIKDMTAIAKVAERFREAGRVFANPSGTARAIANVGAGTSAATAAISGRFDILAQIMGIAAMANMSARLFTSPKFVNFLARSSEVPASRMPVLISRLGTAMASEPEDVQVELAAFLDQLSDAFSAISSTTRDQK